MNSENQAHPSDRQEVVYKRPMFFKRHLIVKSRYQYFLLGYSYMTGLLFVGIVLGFQSMTSSESSLSQRLTLYAGAFSLLFLQVYLGYLLANKILGPIERLLGQLENIKTKGVIAPLNIRKGDALEELVTAINEVLVHNKPKEKHESAQDK